MMVSSIDRIYDDRSEWKEDKFFVLVSVAGNLKSKILTQNICDKVKKSHYYKKFKDISGTVSAGITRCYSKNHFNTKLKKSKEALACGKTDDIKNVTLATHVNFLKLLVKDLL